MSRTLAELAVAMHVSPGALDRVHRADPRMIVTLREVLRVQTERIRAHGR